MKQTKRAASGEPKTQGSTHRKAKTSVPKEHTDSINYLPNDTKVKNSLSPKETWKKYLEENSVTENITNTTRVDTRSFTDFEKHLETSNYVKNVLAHLRNTSRIYARSEDTSSLSGNSHESKSSCNRGHLSRSNNEEPMTSKNTVDSNICTDSVIPLKKKRKLRTSGGNPQIYEDVFDESEQHTKSRKEVHMSNSTELSDTSFIKNKAPEHKLKKNKFAVIKQNLYDIPPLTDVNKMNQLMKDTQNKTGNLNADSEMTKNYDLPKIESSSDSISKLTPKSVLRKVKSKAHGKNQFESVIATCNTIVPVAEEENKTENIFSATSSSIDLAPVSAGHNFRQNRMKRNIYYSVVEHPLVEDPVRNMHENVNVSHTVEEQCKDISTEIDVLKPFPTANIVGKRNKKHLQHNYFESVVGSDEIAKQNVEEQHSDNGLAESYTQSMLKANTKENVDTLSPKAFAMKALLKNYNSMPPQTTHLHFRNYQPFRAHSDSSTFCGFKPKSTSSKIYLAKDYHSNSVHDYSEVSSDLTFDSSQMRAHSTMVKKRSPSTSHKRETTTRRRRTQTFMDLVQVSPESGEKSSSETDKASIRDNNSTLSGKENEKEPTFGNERNNNVLKYSKLKTNEHSSNIVEKDDANFGNKFSGPEKLYSVSPVVKSDSIPTNILKKLTSSGQASKLSFSENEVSHVFRHVNHKSKSLAKSSSINSQEEIVSVDSKNEKEQQRNIKRILSEHEDPPENTVYNEIIKPQSMRCDARKSISLISVENVSSHSTSKRHEKSYRHAEIERVSQGDTLANKISYSEVEGLNPRRSDKISLGDKRRMSSNDSFVAISHNELSPTDVLTTKKGNNLTSSKISVASIENKPDYEGTPNCSEEHCTSKGTQEQREGSLLSAPHVNEKFPEENVSLNIVNSSNTRRKQNNKNSTGNYLSNAEADFLDLVGISRENDDKRPDNDYLKDSIHRGGQSGNKKVISTDTRPQPPVDYDTNGTQGERPVIIGELLKKTKQTIHQKKLNVKQTQKKPTTCTHFLIDGETYHKPKLAKPKPWVNQRFYNHLLPKFDKKYGLSGSIVCEEFAKLLCTEVTACIRNRKDWDKHVYNVQKLLSEHLPINTRTDYLIFAEDYLPDEFVVKMGVTFEKRNRLK